MPKWGSELDSPPRRRSDIQAPPDMKEQYRNRRAPRDKELMEKKMLWEAPSLLYNNYGLRGVLRSFMYETYDTGTEGLYSALEVAQIKWVTIELNSAVFGTGKELLKMVATLTEGMSKLVQDNLMELANNFADLASELRF